MKLVSVMNHHLKEDLPEKNLFEYNEKSTEDLIISESKDEDLIYNSTTQPQNILTEINLD